MIAYRDVITASRPFALIRQDIECDRLAHSYMFISEDKDTLRSFTQLFAELIYCDSHSACGKCLTCERIESNNYTNITTLTSDTTIKVDDIRDLIDSTFISAMEDGVKLYAIIDGERMNEACQNKLLKTLEEPSADVIIVICTTNENSMLQTIRSRCKKVHVNVWNSDSIRAELGKICDDSDRISLACRFGGNNITRAMAILADDEFYRKYDNVNTLLNDYKGSADIAGYLGIFGDSKEEIAVHLGIFENVISYLTREAISGNQHGVYSIRVLANLYDLIIDSYKRLNSNCNIGNVMYNLLMQLAEIKYVL